MLENVFLANFRGFCAGVDYAVKALEDLVKVNKPVYAKHQIVHNNHVVESFKRRGVIFVEELKEIPEGNVVLLSAHGSPKDTKDEAISLGLKPYDAVCPLVAKVQKEVIRYSNQGCSIIYICHKNHIEAKGIMSFAELNPVETLEDVKNLKIINNRIVYLTQTTLSLDEVNPLVNKIKEKYPNIISPKKEDICYATQNRQNSVKDLSNLCDLILVIGSDLSSNSKRLVETSLFNETNSHLIESFNDIQDSWLENIKNLGITTSASAPEFLLEETLDYLQHKYGDFNLINKNRVEEGIYFKPLEI